MLGEPGSAVSLHVASGATVKVVELRRSLIFSHESQMNAQCTDRYAEQYHRGTEYREPLGFARYLINLTLTWGDAADQVETYTSLNDHPGDWELNWLINGEVIRTFHFEVDDNGLILPPDDADETGLTLPPRTHLVRMEIPPGGSMADARLTDE